MAILEMFGHKNGNKCFTRFLYAMKDGYFLDITFGTWENRT